MNMGEADDSRRKTVGLLKKAHLLCCAANRNVQSIFIYASRFDFFARFAYEHF